jgi:predicted component of type VI protein secretion system
MNPTELYCQGRLNDAIQALSAELRDHPTDTRRRTFLFELLCFAGEYERADKPKVRIIPGPLALERYKDFLPDGECWAQLRDWARFFSNDEWDFELKLILERQEVPPCALGAEAGTEPQLGWVSWVKSAPFTRDPGDTVLALA